MANGRLGAADLVANTNTTLYNPVGATGAVTVSVVNRNAGGALVRLALATTATPTGSEWLEFDAYLPTAGVLERTAIVVGPGQFLVVHSSAASVSAVAFGFEE
ncbi:hypothetical protein LJR118_000618 [Acidovorax sp. LjRoot118]|uniref:hypothetical protein n=1 Tax=Acidovorax sp. LjRoot118 TaxID=3342256 RepID=UPI003ECFC19A